MTRPLIQINDEVREMNDTEYAQWIASESERKENAAASIRAERNMLLTQCDWTQLDDTPLSNTAKASWAAYRQALRDISSQSGFPWNVQWPSKPE